MRFSKLKKEIEEMLTTELNFYWESSSGTGCKLDVPVSIATQCAVRATKLVEKEYERWIKKHSEISPEKKYGVGLAHVLREK